MVMRMEGGLLPPWIVSADGNVSLSEVLNGAARADCSLLHQLDLSLQGFARHPDSAAARTHGDGPRRRLEALLASFNHGGQQLGLGGLLGGCSSLSGGLGDPSSGGQVGDDVGSGGHWADCLGPLNYGAWAPKGQAPRADSLISIADLKNCYSSRHWGS